MSYIKFSSHSFVILEEFLYLRKANRRLESALTHGREKQCHLVMPIKLI